MIWRNRFLTASKAALVHFLLSIAVALLVATLVFGFWFPGSYASMTGGTELLWLVVSVDVVCGPLLTFVVFDKEKSRREKITDLGLIALVQLAALFYGVWTVWQVRPLYLPHEVDRFKVISLADLRGASLANLPDELQPGFFKKPIIVALREPKDTNERYEVLAEALQGGADYGERPDFYLPWSDQAAAKALLRAKKITDFITRHPEREPDLRKLSVEYSQDISQMRYLPIKARNDWIAVLTPTGHIAGFVPGDGF
jgi:hypothetical protein